MGILRWRAWQSTIPRLAWNVQHALSCPALAAPHHQQQRHATSTVPETPSKQEILNKLISLNPNPTDESDARHLFHQLAPHFASLTTHELVDTICLAARHPSAAAALELHTAVRKAASDAMLTQPLLQPTDAVNPHTLDKFIRGLTLLNLPKTAPESIGLALHVLAGHTPFISTDEFVQALYKVSRVRDVPWVEMTKPELVQPVQDVLANYELDGLQASMLASSVANLRIKLSHSAVADLCHLLNRTLSTMNSDSLALTITALRTSRDLRSMISIPSLCHKLQQVLPMADPYTLVTIIVFASQHPPLRSMFSWPVCLERVRECIDDLTTRQQILTLRSMISIPHQYNRLVNDLALRILKDPGAQARDITETAHVIAQLQYSFDPTLQELLVDRLRSMFLKRRDLGQLLKACATLRFRLPDNVVARLIRPMLEAPQKCEPFAISQVILALAILHNTLSLKATLSLLASLHTRLQQPASRESTEIHDAACMAVYGAVIMWADHPSRLPAVHEACAALAAATRLDSAHAWNASKMVYANEAMALLGMGHLVDAPTTDRWRAEAARHERNQSATGRLIYNAGMTLASIAKSVSSSDGAAMDFVLWTSVETFVPFLPSAWPIPVKLTGAEGQPNVALLVTGMFDTVSNEPHMLRGDVQLRRKLLQASGYLVVCVDVNEVMAMKDSDRRSAWLLSKIIEAVEGRGV